MRILMVEPTGRGAHHRYALCLCRALERLGVTVDLLSSAPEAPGRAAIRLLPMREFAGFRIPLLGRAARKLDRTLRLWINHRRLLRAVRSGRYRLVHLQILHAVFLPSLARACRAAAAGLVVTRHNIHSHYPHKWLWNAMNQWVFRRHCREVDAWVAHTPFHRRGLEAAGVPPERIRVIPFGPHPEPGSGAVAAREPGSVLMAGGLRFNKGVDTLLQALKILDARRGPHDPVVSVRIVGRAASRKTARRIAAAAASLQRIQLEHVNRYLTGPAYWRFFARSMVLVLPYKRGFAALSGVLLDGYLHDNELVVTEAGANGEVVREDDTGVVVSPEDPAALAEALAKVLEGGVDPRRSINRRRALENRFNWEIAARGTRDLYVSLKA